MTNTIGIPYKDGELLIEITESSGYISISIHDESKHGKIPNLWYNKGVFKISYEK